MTNRATVDVVSYAGTNYTVRIENNFQYGFVTVDGHPPDDNIQLLKTVYEIASEEYDYFDAAILFDYVERNKKNMTVRGELLSYKKFSHIFKD